MNSFISAKREHLASSRKCVSYWRFKGDQNSAVVMKVPAYCGERNKLVPTLKHGCTREKKLEIYGEERPLGNTIKHRNDSLWRKKNRKMIKQLKFIAGPPKESGSHYWQVSWITKTENPLFFHHRPVHLGVAICQNHMRKGLQKHSQFMAFHGVPGTAQNPTLALIFLSSFAEPQWHSQTEKGSIWPEPGLLFAKIHCSFGF